MTRALVGALLWLLVATLAMAEDWPTAAHDAARTGRTPDVVAPPFRVRWAKAWQYENIATISQLIVAEGRGFIGTLGRDNSLAGRVHCVDLQNGRDLWTFDDLAGGVAHTLTWSPHAGGTVYAATTAGEVTALEAASGKLRWKFTTPLGGFVVNPCVAEGAVLLGSRQGVFYALEETDGSVRWQRDVGIPICHTAAAADGVVYFLDEGIHAWGLRIADGSLADRWTGRQLHGGSARFYWPVITKEHVLLTVAPPHKYNWGETDDLLFKVPSVANRKQGDYGAIGTPEQHRQEQANVIEFLKSQPHNQVLHCLDRNTARDACIPGVLYTGGSGSECAPPVLTKDDQIVVEYRSYYSAWDSDSWVNPYSALGALDPVTGVVTQLRPQLQGGRVPWGHIWIIADESSSFSVAGETLLVSHQGNFGGFDLKQGKTFAGVGKRDTWGGYPPLSWNRQEWHGGPRSPLTVVDGTVYYVVGGRVIACEGNAAPGAKSAEPVVVPSPEKIAPLPEFAERPRNPTREDLWKIVDARAKRKPAEPPAGAEALRQALAKHVADLLEYERHDPFVEWRGISPTGQSMQSPAELVYALSLAMPHLEKEQQRKVRERLNKLTNQRGVFSILPAPLPSTSEGKGEPRNFHKLAPRERSGRDFLSSSPTARREAATALAFYEAMQTDSARHITFSTIEPGGFRPEAVELLGNLAEPWRRPLSENRQLVNQLADLQCSRRFDDRIDARKMDALFQMVERYLTEYRRIGRACAEHIDAVPSGDRHPSAGGQYRNLGGPYVGQIHAAAIVAWTDLSPEVGQILREFAPAETEAIRRWMLRNAQGFYLVRWDTPVQEGEVACPWYITTQNYFHLFSTIGDANAATHKLLVDMPACHADVYYIERLVRAIER